MTDKKAERDGWRRSLRSAYTGSLGFELHRTGARSVLTLEGVVSVLRIADECIRLATHGGIVSVNGTGLLLSVFEARCVRIFGKISSVELGYGRS